MLSRRAILYTGGAGIVLLGVGAMAAKALHSDLSVARQPWAQAGDDFGDMRINALSYAVLAPNPHNRQPWLVRLEGSDRLTLYCDRDRLLPETDPPNRQIVIGLGAFLELLRQAAAQEGYRLNIVPFPDGEPQPILDDRPVAAVRFIPDKDVKADPLFGAALTRRTVRSKFDQAKPVEGEILDALGSVLGEDQGAFSWANDAQGVETLKQLCRAGWQIESTTARTHHESTALMRIGEAEINDNPDGISLSGPVMEGMRIAGVLTRDNLNDMSSTAFREGQKFYSDAIDTAMAFGWLVTENNRRVDQLQSGAGWIRIHLAAEQQGLAMHPLSQVLQEFPEMAGEYRKMHDYAGADGDQCVQGLFRFGYAKNPPPAPRWTISSRLVAA